MSYFAIKWKCEMRILHDLIVIAQLICSKKQFKYGRRKVYCSFQDETELV